MKKINTNCLKRGEKEKQEVLSEDSRFFFSFFVMERKSLLTIV